MEATWASVVMSPSGTVVAATAVEADGSGRDCEIVKLPITAWSTEWSLRGTTAMGRRGWLNVIALADEPYDCKL